MKKFSHLIRFFLFSALIGGNLACAAESTSEITEKEPIDFQYDPSPLQNGGPAEVVSYADVLERATPSVVAVYTARFVTAPRRGGSNRNVEELFRQFGLPVPDNAPSDEDAPRQRRRSGVGSGVIVSPNGYIVTNHHVITDRSGRPVDEIRVQLADGREFEAEMIGSDEATDVAVLKIESDEALPAVTLANSDNLRVGDVVFAIGNPLEVGMTATMGIVSATGRTSLNILGRGSYEDFIQTDAAINLGNSGGALVDAKGRLIGINTAIFSRTGGNIGIGFAIPVNMAERVMRSLSETGAVARGVLGLLPESLNRDFAEAFNLDSTRGALVQQVLEGSPAYEAGIQHGDVIVAIDDREIVNADQLRLIVSQTAPGTEVSVEIIRDSEVMTIPVTLGSLDTDFAASPAPAQRILDGVHISPLDQEDLRSQYEVPSSVEGLLVTEVSDSSPYIDTLRPGMVIIGVNGRSVRTNDSLESALRPGANRLYVWFQGNLRYTVLRVSE